MYVCYFWKHACEPNVFVLEIVPNFIWCWNKYLPIDKMLPKNGVVAPVALRNHMRSCARAYGYGKQLCWGEGKVKNTMKSTLEINTVYPHKVVVAYAPFKDYPR